MQRSHLVRRAGRLLGAATVAGVLSAGLLAAAPLAEVDINSSRTGANGVSYVALHEVDSSATHVAAAAQEANGI